MGYRGEDLETRNPSMALSLRELQLHGLSCYIETGCHHIIKQTTNIHTQSEENVARNGDGCEDDSESSTDQGDVDDDGDEYDDDGDGDDEVMMILMLIAVMVMMEKKMLVMSDWLNT